MRAVNIAIALEKPLLIKGEPGTGKTMLAQAVANSLGKKLIVWNVKSTTKAQDGLYMYDTIQRLYDGQFGEEGVDDISRYIKLGKLGEAFEEEEQAVTAPADGVNPLESEKVKNAVKYLTKVLEALGAEDFEIKTTLNGETVFLDIVGEKLGVVIGRRGETLDALQYLTILASNKAEESYCRISVDCNGYRAKRRETLEALAVKTANRVLKQGRRVTLEPMNPYERRIIHSKVAEIEGVFSNSIGEEPFRKVVISSNTKPVYNKNDRRKGGHTVTPGKSYRQSTGFSTSFEREYKRVQAEPVEYSQETVDLEKDSSVLYGKIEL